MDRRYSTRYPLRASAVFSWIDCAGIFRSGFGEILNIGRYGVLVLCERTCPPLFTMIALNVMLPAVRERQGLHLNVSARVVRTEKAADHRAFAAETEFRI